MLIVLAGCAPTLSSERPPLTTLQIENTDATPVQLLVNYGAGPQPWTRAYPGVTCLVIARHRQEGSMTLGIRRLADTQVHWTGPFVPASQPGWTVELGNNVRVGIGSFRGVGSPCRGGQHGSR